MEQVRRLLPPFETRRYATLLRVTAEFCFAATIPITVH
jgi:hypothetical protein